MSEEPKSKASIIRRLDAAIEDMKAEGLTPKAIYLTEHDWLMFDEAASKAWGGKVCAFSHRNVQIFSLDVAPADLPPRQIGRSVLCSVSGAARTIARKIR